MRRSPKRRFQKMLSQLLRIFGQKGIPTPQEICYRKSRMHDLKTLQRKIASCRQEVRNLQVMAMRPDQPHHKVELLRNLERSARAEIKAWLKAKQHLESQGQA